MATHAKRLGGAYLVKNHKAYSRCLIPEILDDFFMYWEVSRKVLILKFEFIMAVTVE
jgi:hypothetical protein